MSVMLNLRLLELMLLVISLVLTISVIANGKPTSSSPSPSPRLASEAIKETRQMDFLTREKYDPYDAQAAALAFRRFKEAQALKEGHRVAHHAPNHNNEDAEAAASSDNADSLYEKRFYDPFFYYTSPTRPQNNNYFVDETRAISNSRNGRYAGNIYYTRDNNNNGLRSRRNTAGSGSSSGAIDNNLLTEDVYFFRRDTSPEARAKQRLEEFEKSPYFYRESQMSAKQQQQRQQQQPEERQFPQTRYPQPISTSSSSSELFSQNHPRNNEIYSTSSARLDLPLSSRHNTVFSGRPSSYYPASNHVDHYEQHRHKYFTDGPRILPINGRENLYPGTVLSGRGAGTTGIPGVNGWTVQVGTQLKVHDDGRTRHPNRYYVRDEKPFPLSRYPHYRDRQ